MSNEEILKLVKFNLGLTTDVRDEYLLGIIKGTRAELLGAGIDPKGQKDSYLETYDLYLIDYVSWLYRNRGGETALPRHLQFRRHNLILNHV